MLGIVVTTEKTMYKKDFPEPLFQSLQEVVGGYVEHVTPMFLENPFCVLINEEGKLKQLPINLIGSMWYGPFDVIVGDIVVMKDGYVDGERDIVGLTDKECLRIIGMVSEMSQGRYRLLDMEGAAK